MSVQNAEHSEKNQHNPNPTQDFKRSRVQEHEGRISYI